jgi:hypothetical protein
MKALRTVQFPPPISRLMRSLSEAGFFDRSLLIGSWVMPLYCELYDVPYVLRTLDVDFAVHLAHPQKQMRADLKRLITDLGFIDFIAAAGVQKFAAGGYEVEFIAHRPGGKDIGILAVREWNINALPLPFISILWPVSVDLLQRAVPAKHTEEGLRALSGENPIRPESVQKYLEGKFGDALGDVSKVMLEPAKSLSASQLAEKAYTLYEKFRPEIPPGKKGWGASGKLDLDLIRKMASA